MARDFDGVDDIVNWGTGGGVGATSPWSAFALVRPDTLSGFTAIVLKRSAFNTGTNQFTFYFNGNKLGFTIDVQTVEGAINVPTGAWNAVSCAGDASGGAYYVNGVADVASGGNSNLGANWLSGTNTNQPLSIGGAVTENNQYFDGAIAEVALWNVKLNNEQHIALSKGASPFIIRRDGLVHYFPLIGRASPEIDRVGGLVGTLTGTANFAHPRIIYGKRRLA